MHDHRTKYTHYPTIRRDWLNFMIGDNEAAYQLHKCVAFSEFCEEIGETIEETIPNAIQAWRKIRMIGNEYTEEKTLIRKDSEL